MKTKIINILKNADGYVSGQELSDTLGVSRTAVWKAINSLRESGYEIKSSTNKGYMLNSVPFVINENEIKDNLHTRIFGKDIFILDSVDSTNTYAKELGAKGYKSGTVVVAREQTNGKGRLGREWVSQKDGGIWFSVLLRPDLSPMEISGVTPLAGLAVCKAINQYCSLNCKIKWPNDVIIGNKKLVGILTEMVAEFDAVEYIVIGIGINCNFSSFSEDIQNKATSLSIETGSKINQSKLLAKILECMEKEMLSSGCKLNTVNLQEYTKLCATIGRKISFFRANNKVSAVAMDIDQSGELIVMMNDGTTCNINAGEVTVQGIY